MNNENPKQQLIDEYIKKVNNTPDIELNQDQKELIKEILTKIDPKYIQNAYQMLNQRVKIGFTFDEAPSTSKTNIALLAKDEKRSFINNVMDASDFENYLIIGENYDALKNLIQIEKIRAMTGGGHSDFDIIYIDPPYNTESAKTDGNVSANNNENISASKFIYRDKFSRNGWLNMMKERLIMARQLLKEDGVIFVSIDDNEQAYLKVLMDEIFGEENFVCNFVIDKTAQGANNSSTFKLQHEYCLFYKKNIFNEINTKNSREFDAKKYKYKDEKGFFAITNAFDSINSPLEKNKNRGYTIYYNPEINDAKIKNEYDVNNHKFGEFDTELLSQGYISFRPGIRKGIQYPWNWAADRFLSDFKTELFFSIKDNKKNIYHKNRWNDAIKDTTIKCFDTRKFGNQILIDVLDEKKFSYPKSIDFLKWIVSKHLNKNARILDFFAGSGTTGHAVLELNREDGGSRTYTLVTNNENNIGSNITYERLYRINNGKGTKGEDNFKWLEKNDPYKQNLNVYNIEYYDASIDKREKDESDDVSLKLLKKLDELLNSLNLKSTEINNEQKLNILSQLNALEKKGTTNESK